MSKRPKTTVDILTSTLMGDCVLNDDQTLPIDFLTFFPDHKFKLYEGERLESMVESIKSMGVLQPLIVWKNGEEYIILSGHNRLIAGKQAGLTELPVIIKDDLSLEDATLIVTETNLHQRSFSELSHSERAFALAQHYEAVKNQGKRTDIIQELSDLMTTTTSDSDSTLSHNGTKLRSDQMVGENFGLSRNSVARYIRLSKLNKDLLDKIDEGKLGVTPAYPLTFITDDGLQSEIADQIERGNRMDVKTAETLREQFTNHTLKKETISEVCQDKTKEIEKKEITKKEKPVVVSQKLRETYFSNISDVAEIEKILEEALKAYYDNK